MKAVIVANKESLLPLCGEMVIERLIKKLKDYGFDGIYVYPLSYSRIIKNDEVKFIGSLEKIRDDVFVIKGNVFLSRLHLCRENIFKTRDGSIVAFYGKPSTNFKRKGKACRIEGFEIKNDDDIKKAEMILQMKRGDVIYRYINSKISSVISSRLCPTYIMPWQLIAVSFLISLLSMIFFINKSYVYAAIAAILVEISAVVKDSGEEMMIVKSNRIQAVKSLPLFPAIIGGAYHAWAEGASFYIWIAAILIAMAIAIMQRGGEGYAGEDFLMFSIFIGCLVNQLLFAFIIVAILMNGEAIRRVISAS